MIIIFSKYLVFLNIVTTFATNYEYKKQNIQYCPLRQFVGVHFICCIYPIHQPGGVLYGTRPFRIYFRSPLLPYLAVETFRPDAVCRCLANPTFLPTRFRFCRAGSYLGANFLGGNQSIPVTRKCLCTDALACSLPAHLSGRSRLLDLCLNHQRLLVLTVGRLSHHAAASVGGPLHPAQMASGLVSDWRLPLSGAWVVCHALCAVLSGCRESHLAGVYSDCFADFHRLHLAYATLFIPEGQ